MSRTRRSQNGMSLVEATVILMVLSVLTAVLAPTARAYIEDARNAKAKSDVEAIGAAIDQVLRDTGLPCLSLAPGTASTACNRANKVELLVSSTSVGTDEPTVVTNFLSVTANTASAANLNWAGGTNEVADAARDSMQDQFTTNAAGYAGLTFPSGSGPRTGIGWRGPYVNAPFDVDPWGYVYQASTIFLSTAFDADNSGSGNGAGQRRGGWENDVVVISAGSNGVIQTAFGAVGTAAIGDDIVYVVQGSSH